MRGQLLQLLLVGYGFCRQVLQRPHDLMKNNTSITTGTICQRDEYMEDDCSMQVVTLQL